MSLAAGASLGPYRIDARIDAGGMGEVFRGTDTRLNRTVAIKVLHANRAAGPEFQRRFEIEAKAVSSLNHPNICILHDVGRHQDVDYLVMEYLAGETLRAVLTNGPLPVPVALRYTEQILHALEHAHGRGVIHRDLKPGNIMLVGSPAARAVKLLDFGLAQTAQAPRSGNPQEASTELALTAPGDVVGTPQYMAPEVLQRMPADARSDLHALGAILYEMLTGIKAFDGDTQAHVLASVLRDVPKPVSSLRPEVPHALDAIVQRCLEKNPADRWQSASDLRAVLEIYAGPQFSPPRAITTAQSGNFKWLAAASLLLISALAIAAVWLARRPAPAPSLRFTVAAPDGYFFAPRGCASSPNGRNLACVVIPAKGGRERLWIRPLDSRPLQPIDGTEDASGPFWSPDGRFVGFFAEGKLKKLNLDNRTIQNICPASADLGATWGPSGDIVFSPFNRIALQRVSAAGGDPQPLTTLATSKGENSHRWPQFLPDGRHFLFIARSSVASNTSVMIGSLDSKETRRLFPAQSNATFVQPNRILFARQKTLLSQILNPKTFQLEGNSEPVPDIPPIGQQTPSASAYFTASVDGGLLAYQAPDIVSTQLTWFDRSGRHLSLIGPESPDVIMQPRISPDGRLAAVALPEHETGNRDIYLLNLSNGLMTRLTSNPANDWFPVWSPDGRRIVFASDRTVPATIWRMTPNGESTEEQLFQVDADVTDMSEDGNFLLGTIRPDIFVFPLVGDRKPYLLIHGLQGVLDDGHITRNGKAVAFTSNEAGVRNIYVASFKQHDKQRVSADGGYSPTWRGDGKELFYASPEGRIMSVEIEIGDTIRAGAPRALFSACRPAQPLRGAEHFYDVSADGQKFLISCNVDSPGRSLVNVDLGWTSRLAKTAASQ